MTPQTLPQVEIDRLNSLAAEWLAAHPGLVAYDALETTAREAGLKRVFSDYDSEIWQSSAGELVNMWTHSPELGDGESGFDDQVEYYTEAENE